MQIGPFLDLLAETYGEDPKTIAVLGRFMRQAGWITTGARGVNAPHMTARDAARMTIAILTSEAPKAAVEGFQHFRKLQPLYPLNPDNGFFEQAGLAQDHTIEDALTVLFDFYADEERMVPFREDVFGVAMNPLCKITLYENSRNITVRFPGDDHKVVYEDLDGLHLHSEKSAEFRTALEDGDLDRAAEIQSAIAEFVYPRGHKGKRSSHEITAVELTIIASAMKGAV